MSLVIVLALALAAAAVIVYPLLPGRRPVQMASALTDGDIEREVRRLRQARRQGALLCPHCGRAYQAGDRFCVACGGELPVEPATPAGAVCPQCGAPLRPDDRFCAKCGHSVAPQEAA